MEADIIRLFMEYLSGNMEDSRREELRHWIGEKEENRLLFEKVCSGRLFAERLKARENINLEMAIRRFDRQVGKVPLTISLRKYAIYAAIMLLLVSIGGGLLWVHSQKNVQETEKGASADIAPGASRAILVLATGQQVELTAQDSLEVDLGQGKRVINRNEQLTYTKNKPSESLQYNELKVPCGGEYQVILSDGTIVRLNSASSLKYPIAFGKEKREVELTGEAFFKVSKNRAPFLVNIGDMTVKVYGTTFNINSQLENRIQTALVEGKVGIKVKGKAEEFLLTSSQLADFDVRNRTMDIQRTDLTPYYAWTKGLFMFNNESLRQIMSTLALWYNMDVFFQNPALQELHFTGCVKRYDQIETILKALSRSVGVKFNRQGKTLTISM